MLDTNMWYSNLCGVTSSKGNKFDTRLKFSQTPTTTRCQQNMCFSIVTCYDYVSFFLKRVNT